MATETKEYNGVGEILWDKDKIFIDKDSPSPEMINMKDRAVLMVWTSQFPGMVGEHIEIYSYVVLSWAGGIPKIKPIKSVAQFKEEVYPYLFKDHRVKYWGLMKRNSFFGWSEDPRPYVI